MKNLIKNSKFFKSAIFSLLICLSFFYFYSAHKIKEQIKLDNAFVEELKKDERHISIIVSGMLISNVENSQRLAAFYLKLREEKVKDYEKRNPDTTISMQDIRNWQKEFLKYHPEVPIL